MYFASYLIQEYTGLFELHASRYSTVHLLMRTRLGIDVY